MGVRFFSTRNRLPHLGPYPLERLKRAAAIPDLSNLPPTPSLNFSKLDTPHSLVNAMGEYQAMMDVLRAGPENSELAAAPTDPTERANHMKSFGYFQDASMIGICKMPEGAVLAEATRNPDIDRLSDDIRTKQTKTLASGIDEIMASLRETVDTPLGSIDSHTHAIVVLFEHTRAPDKNEPGSEWINDACSYRAALRATETAVILSSYFQLLGYQARAHTATSSDVDLNILTVAAGLASLENGEVVAPFIGTGFGVAVVTTNMEMTTEEPLAPLSQQTNGPAWWLCLLYTSPSPRDATLYRMPSSA